MTTPVLTEDGKRLAEALVKVGILKTGNGWMHPTDDWYTFDVPPALNTAAASLRLSLEGDASLREALEKIACECDPDDPEWKAPASGRALCFRIASAALARPQPEAKGPVAAGGDLRMASWRCPDCRCHTFAAVDKRKADGSFGPGSLVRCVNCKGTFPASTTPPAEAKTPDAGVDPSRKLKEALFACLNAGDEFRQYGGVLMSDGRKAWVRFTAETPEASALLASQPHSRPVGATQAPEVLTPTGSAGEDDTGVREALKSLVEHVHASRYRCERTGLRLDANVPAFDQAEQASSIAPPAAWEPHPGCSYDTCRSFHECQRPEDCHIVHAPQPPKAETPAGVGEAPGCRTCGAPLTSEEVEFYTSGCESCERAAHLGTDSGSMPPAAYFFALEKWGSTWVTNEFASLREFAALSTAPAARSGDEVFPVGTPVEKTTGEYDFPGTVVAAFDKLGGQRRYVVEDDRRSLHIFSATNLRVRPAAAPAADGGRG